MTREVPQLKRDEALKLLAKRGFNFDSVKACILAIRGYYKRTKGNPKHNDRGIYDDAIFVISEKIFSAYVANTDPSIYRKGTAVLCEGVYDIVPHMHKGKYPAWQIVLDYIKRDGSDKVEIGRHGINIHHGGVGTWSEGCQTLPPDTWLSFQRLTYDIADSLNKKSLKYILIENK